MLDLGMVVSIIAQSTMSRSRFLKRPTMAVASSRSLPTNFRAPVRRQGPLARYMAPLTMKQRSMINGGDGCWAFGLPSGLDNEPDNTLSPSEEATGSTFKAWLRLWISRSPKAHLLTSNCLTGRQAVGGRGGLFVGFAA